MSREIKIHVYANISQYREVHNKMSPHFTLIFISFHRDDDLIMPKIIIEHPDGKKDLPYHGFDGIDKVIKKYGSKDPISRGH